MRAAALLFVFTSLVSLGAAAADPVDTEPYAERFGLDIEKPGGMAHDGELVWVTDRVEGKLRGLDPRTGREKRVLPAPGPAPSGLAHDGELLWVADRKRNLLFGVDLASEIVVRELPAPKNPQGLAHDGTHLWVADGKRLHQVTTEDGTTIKSVRAPAWTGKGKGTEQLGLAYDAGSLWVSDRQRDMIYRVEPEEGEVIDLVPAPGPFPAGMVVVDGKLLVAEVDRRRVDVLAHRSLPRVVRRDPRKETIVLRRTVTNRGPGTLVEAHVYVAVPHSLPSQALVGKPRFSPRPRGFVEDRWGQRFAHFEARNLAPGASLEIEMTVRATVFEAQYHVDPAQVGGLKAIPADVRKAYLEDASKFAIGHPSIKKHLKSALKGEKRPYWMIRRIARYIQKKMHYELAGGWNIAPTVIDRGSGSCSEYTFVFIAMCRAAGIPARYVGALVVRGDDAATDEVFHRWAEVYLPGYGWVPHDVQHGDKPEPEKRGSAFGTLVNRFLITTIGGGGSEYIGWDYNSTASWSCRGRCEVDDLHVGDWYPADRGPAKP